MFVDQRLGHSSYLVDPGDGGPETWAGSSGQSLVVGQ
jgi:hypothetical protein